MTVHDNENAERLDEYKDDAEGERIIFNWKHEKKKPCENNNIAIKESVIFKTRKKKRGAAHRRRMTEQMYFNVESSKAPSSVNASISLLALPEPPLDTGLVCTGFRTGCELLEEGIFPEFSSFI